MGECGEGGEKSNLGWGQPTIQSADPGPLGDKGGYKGQTGLTGVPGFNEHIEMFDDNMPETADSIENAYSYRLFWYFLSIVDTLAFSIWAGMTSGQIPWFIWLGMGVGGLSTFLSCFCKGCKPGMPRRMCCPLLLGWDPSYI